MYLVCSELVYSDENNPNFLGRNDTALLHCSVLGVIEVLNFNVMIQVIFNHHHHHNH